MQKFSLLIRYILASLLICPTLFSQPVGPITYLDLGNDIISAHGQMASSGKPDIDQSMRAIVYALFAMHETCAERPEEINQAIRFLIHDLEMFNSAGENKTYEGTGFAKINNAVTLFGEAVLAKMLVTPTTDLIILQARQALVKELVNNEDLFNEIDALLHAVKKREKDLLSFWQEEDPVAQRATNVFYFDKFKKFNRDPIALELLAQKNNLGHLYSLCSDIIGELVLMRGIEWLSVRSQQNAQANPLIAAGVVKDLDEALAKGLINHDLVEKHSWPTMLWAAVKQCYWPFAIFELKDKIQNGGYDKELLRLMQPDLLDEGKAALGVVLRMKAISNILTLFLYKKDQFKNVYKQFTLNAAIALSVQTKLMGIAELINTLDAIHQVMQSNEQIANGLLMGGHINKLFSAQKSKQFAELVAMLQTNTFKGDPSFFSYTGRIFAANSLMMKHKEKFIDPMQSLGELDACMSIAKLVKQYQQHERVKVCFAQFTNSALPHMQIADFWNMQIDPAVVVVNSLEMGAPGKERNILLTGSNTGGKSTLLKAVGLDVLLAQTFGVAAASAMTLTPFCYFSSSMNIVDDTAGGKSLYMKEVERAALLIKAAIACEQEGKLVLLIIDELFRGTGPEKADIETYQCAQRLNDLPGTMYILATHYKNNPIKLEAETNGLCKNYKVDAYVDAQGNIVHPFKLEVGVSQSNIAGDILQGALG